MKTRIEDYIESIPREKIATWVSMLLNEIAKKVKRRLNDYIYLEDLIEDFKKIDDYEIVFYDIESFVSAEFEYKYQHYGEITSHDEQDYLQAIEIILNKIYVSDEEQ